MKPLPGASLPHSVIVGDGFAGLAFGRRFLEGLARITIADRQNHLMQWAYSYFTYKRGARIITGVSGERLAGSA